MNYIQTQFQYFLSILLTTIFLFLASVLFAQTVSNDYSVKNFSLSEGLPQSSINDIIQTKDGYMWLATFGGLVRFDGSNFTVFNRSNIKGMTTDRILSLFEDATGAIWLGAENAFLRFKNGVCTDFSIPNEKQVYCPLLVSEDLNGILWITINDKIYRFQNEHFIETPINTDQQGVERALRDQTGTWLAFGKSIFRTSGDFAFQVAYLEKEISHNIQDIVEFPKGSGQVFFTTNGDGVGKIENGKAVFFTVKDGLTSVETKRFFIDRLGQLWVVAYNGVSKWTGNHFIPFKTIKGYADLQYNTIFQDNEGNYWVGTTSKGLFKIKKNLIHTIGVEEGLSSINMLSATQLANGKILFSTNCGGVFQWDQKKATYSSVNKFLPNICVWSVFQDSKQRIWFGSRLLYQTTDLNKKGKLFNLSSEGRSNEVFSITEDHTGKIWIGTLDGIYIYNDTTFTHLTDADGLSNNETKVLFEDREKIMWVGTLSGVYQIKSNQVIPVLLRENKSQTEPYVRAIYQDKEGVFWFGTYGDGLIRLKNGIRTAITVNSGLFDNIVSHVIEDKHGNLWMGSNRGIYRVSLKELNDFCDKKISPIHSFSYGISDGMKSPETNGGFQPNVFMDENEKIYFPTVEGIAVVSSGQVSYNPIPPSVIIENIQVENEDKPIIGNITLPYDSTTININYTAINFSDPQKVQFKYKMSGLNVNWISVGNNKSAFFSQLQPGNYTFQVMASNNDGIWNTVGDFINITVTPPFWLETWFIFLMSVSILALGIVIYNYRISIVEREREQKELFSQQLIQTQEQERSRIASELHDGIGQQILVVKNRAELALKQIDKPEKLKEQLTEIIDSAMSSITDVRSISHNLRPIHLEKFGLTETVVNLCEQLKNTSDMSWFYHIDNIDGMIPKEKEINFYRIIQEAANNILRHSQAKEASVIIRVQQADFLCQLWDDGKGFDLTEMRKKGGLGITGIEERVKSLNGTVDFQSSISAGTFIKIKIPKG